MPLPGGNFNSVPIAPPSGLLQNRISLPLFNRFFGTLKD
jgi:hypothetical protein